MRFRSIISAYLHNTHILSYIKFNLNQQLNGYYQIKILKMLGKGEKAKKVENH